MPTCKGCGKEIRFIRSKAGRSIPCDAQPVRYIKNPRGQDSIVTEDGEVIRGTVVNVQTLATGVGYISHFATCPQADRFRRR